MKINREDLSPEQIAFGDKLYKAGSEIGELVKKEFDRRGLDPVERDIVLAEACSWLLALNGFSLGVDFSDDLAVSEYLGAWNDMASECAGHAGRAMLEKGKATRQ